MGLALCCSLSLQQRSLPHLQMTAAHKTANLDLDLSRNLYSGCLYFSFCVSDVVDVVSRACVAYPCTASGACNGGRLVPPGMRLQFASKDAHLGRPLHGERSLQRRQTSPSRDAFAVCIQRRPSWQTLARRAELATAAD